MPAIATYPGTVSPLRGLHPFAESEREVFFGREADTETLANMVTSDGFRAGLLHGEAGVGKSSLLRAGLVPHLRDHGVIALLCSDVRRPVESFVHELAAVTGTVPEEGEAPMKFLSRAVGSSIPGQRYLFIIDDVGAALSGGDQIVHDLGDLYARVVTRSGGRARFLFCCDNDSVHRFGALEQRTGSLFPPSNRYELARLSPADAVMVLSRALALSGLADDVQLAQAVVEALARSGPILPADLQIAALGLIQLELTSPAALQKIGGAAEIERAWLKAGAAATGNELMALRLMAELAGDAHGLTAYTPEWAAARASVDPAFASHALPVLEDRGITRAAPGEAGTLYSLAHAILTPRVRELAAPAREISRRAFQLLGSKVESGKRMSLGELRALEREGIVPSTPQEHAVVARSKRFFKIVAGAVAATPVVFLAAVFLIMFGQYYIDVRSPPGGGAERVVVRSGRPGFFAAFHWLPGSPPFGAVVADTGFTRPMVQDQAWDRAAARAIGGDVDDYVDAALDLLEPTQRHLIEYATSGQAGALEELRKLVAGPQDLVELLESLSPIARGTTDEVALVESALKDAAPSVQRSALAVAASAAKRSPGMYHDTLAQALTAPNAELRRLAFSAAQDLGDDTARALFRAALALNPEPAARRELLAMVTAADAAATPSAESAASILVNRDVPRRTRERARGLLERAFASDAAAATVAAAELAGDDNALQEDRVLALELMRDFAPEEVHGDIAGDIQGMIRDDDEVIRGAALPLYASIAPKDAAAELVLLLEDEALSEELRVASALAWGEVAAKTRDRAAAAALETLLEDDAPRVQAAAAEAYGNVGRRAQGRLVKMVKEERFDVAVGAAYGLANSVRVGGSSSTAVGGILKLWKRKGRARRKATQVFARMARFRPASVYSYLAAAARSDDDPGLHVLAARGLCNASAVGHRRARRTMARIVEDSATEVRRVIIACIADHSSDPRTATVIATELAGDRDAGIRMDAARVLAGLAAGEKAPRRVPGTLVQLARDDDRRVRLIAIRALAEMGEDAPEGARRALRRAFARAGESEKLTLLEAARQIGAEGIVQQAITDASPPVRVAALDTALATGTEVAATMNAALTDSDRDVRVAALERLASSSDRLDRDALGKSLSLAVRDPDPDIAQLALTTLARLGSSDDVAAQLGRALRQKSERERVRAASACMGLVDREPDRAAELLAPLLDDPSHDVRAAMLPALASAWRVTHTPEQLAAMLESSEKHAMRRIAATAAFLMLAQTDQGREAAEESLSQVAQSGPPLARVYAELGLGLIDSAGNGIGFLQLLTP